MNKFKLAVLTVALAASSIAMAQDKAALVKQLLEVQRPAIDGMARILVNDSVSPILQAGGEYLQTQVPAEKREAAAKAADAELKKYFDEAYPIVRDKAVALAPDALGPILRDNFSEEELRQLLAWINSPLSKKYQELNPKMQTALTEKLVAETRSSIEPKMRTLDANVAKALGAPTEGAAPAKSAPKAPAKK